MQCHPQWTPRRGPAVRRQPALYIAVSIDIGKRCIHGDLSKRKQTLDVGGGRQCVRVCVCCVCVTCTYSGVDIHPSIRTYIYIYSCKMIMYVEVWIIMVCILDVPDPNKHEQPPDVARERPWHLSDSRGVDFLYSFFFWVSLDMVFVLLCRHRLMLILARLRKRQPDGSDSDGADWQSC